MMTKELTVTTEAVDDIPILVVPAEKMGIADLLDEYFEVDSKWQGVVGHRLLLQSARDRTTDIIKFSRHSVYLCIIPQIALCSPNHLASWIS